MGVTSRLKTLLLIAWFPMLVLAGPFESEPVERQVFAALVNHSPFNRMVTPNDSLILTGIARIDDQEVITLLNIETSETFVISELPNPQGWKLVEVRGDEDLERVSAKITIDGGEIVPVRYGKVQVNPGEAKPGAGKNVTEERFKGKGTEGGAKGRDGRGKGKGGGRDGKGKGGGRDGKGKSGRDGKGKGGGRNPPESGTEGGNSLSRVSSPGEFPGKPEMIQGWDTPRGGDLLGFFKMRSQSAAFGLVG